MRAAVLLPLLVLALAPACAADGPSAGVTGAGVHAAGGHAARTQAAGAPAAKAPAACATPAALREIVRERDCFGCPQGERLRVGRDGTAVLTATGKARLRTADVERRAALAPGEFDRLAADLAAAGLFAMAGRHEEPGLADGRWTQWRLVCDGPAGEPAGTATLEVFRREAAGPPALDAADAVLDAWRDRRWPR